MNLADRFNTKGIVSNELLGGQFERMATYSTDGTLRIEQTPDYVPQIGWVGGQKVVLRNWEEIVRLRDFLNSLTPVSIRQAQEEADHIERTA